MRQRSLVVLASALLGAASHAGQAEDRDRSVPADLLRGPTVHDVDVTLVRTDMRGTLQPIEGRPEVAALALVELDPALRERTLEVVRERGRSLEAFLVEHVDDVRTITDAMTAGDRERARELARRMHEAFDPGTPPFPLLEPLRSVLDASSHDRVRAMVESYWAARIDQAAGDRRDDEARRAEVSDRLGFELFQEELRQAYATTLRPYRERMERIFAATDATLEQRAAIREAVLAHIRATRLEPSPEDRRALAERLYAILDEPQRIRLLEASLAGL